MNTANQKVANEKKTIYIIYYCKDFWIVLNNTVLGMFYWDETRCGAEAIAKTATRALLVSGQEARILAIDLTELIDRTMQEQDMEYDGESLTIEWLLENRADRLLNGGKLVEVYPHIQGNSHLRVVDESTEEITMLFNGSATDEAAETGFRIYGVLAGSDQ